MRYLLELQEDRKNSWCPHSPQRSCYNCLSCFTTTLSDRGTIWRGPAPGSHPFGLCTANCIFHNDHSREPLDCGHSPTKVSFLSFPLAWTSTGFLAVSTNKMAAKVMLHDFKIRSQKGYPSTWPPLPLRILALESSHHAVRRLKLAHMERQSGEDLRPQQQPAPTVRTVSGWALSGFQLPIFEPPQLMHSGAEVSPFESCLNFRFISKRNTIILTHYVLSLVTATQTSDGRRIEMNFTWNKTDLMFCSPHFPNANRNKKYTYIVRYWHPAARHLYTAAGSAVGLSPGKPGSPMPGWMQIGGWIACPLPGPLPSQFPLSGHFLVSAASWWCWHKVLQCGLTDNRCRRLQNTWKQTSKSWSSEADGILSFLSYPTFT